jgi:hypothetical protein
LVEAVDGGFRVNLSRIEQRVLQQAFDDLRVMIVNDDPSTKRLTPTAYVDDPALDEEYRKMVGDDLQASQLAAFDVVEHSIDGSTVSRDELEAWMRSVNAVRLVIGTQLDVGEDLVRVDKSDPDYPATWSTTSSATCWPGSSTPSSGPPPKQGHHGPTSPNLRRRDPGSRRDYRFGVRVRVGVRRWWSARCRAGREAIGDRGIGGRGSCAPRDRW